MNHFDRSWKLPQLNGLSLALESAWTTRCRSHLRPLQGSITVPPKPPWRTLQNYLPPLTVTDGTCWVSCVSSAPFCAILPGVSLAVIKLSLPFWLLFTLILKTQLLKREHTRLFIQGHTRSQGSSQNPNLLPDQSTHLLVNTLSHHFCAGFQSSINTPHNHFSASQWVSQGCHISPEWSTHC